MKRLTIILALATLALTAAGCSSGELTARSSCKEWNEHNLQQDVVAEELHNSAGRVSSARVPTVSVLKEELSQVCASAAWQSASVGSVSAQLIEARGERGHYGIGE